MHAFTFLPLFSAETSISTQKRHPYIGDPKSEMSGDSTNAFLHCGDLLALFNPKTPSSYQHVTDSMTVSPSELHCYSHSDAGVLLCTNVQSCICLSLTQAAQQRTRSHPCRLQPLLCMQDTTSNILSVPSDRWAVTAHQQLNLLVKTAPVGGRLHLIT